MAVFVNGTKIKKIIYGGNNVKKAYSGGVCVFTSDHTVTYQIRGQQWTAVIEDGENSITSSANNTARSKIGGYTLVGWTTTSGSTTPISNIPCTDDNMVLYGIYKHDHVGVNTTKSGCYQGASHTTNTVVLQWDDGLITDGCGCTHQTWHWKCNNCGRTWTSTSWMSTNCTQGHNKRDQGNSACTCSGWNKTTYDLSCGLNGGTFCG